MNISVLRDNRRIIPRWRSLSETSGSGLLNCFGNVIPYKENCKLETEFLIRSWTNNKSVENASELFQHAIMLNDLTIAEDSIKYLEKNKDKLLPLVREKINKLYSNNLKTNEEQDQSITQTSYTLDYLYSQINILKQKTRINPKNAFNWVELSRMYTTLHLKEKAFISIRIAYNLFPNNRYILRSLIRFCVHFNEFEFLSKTFTKIDNLYHDPWLLAPYISLKDNLVRTNLNMKKTSSLILSNNKINKTELVSSLASLELKNGAFNRSKKLFRSSLTSANDNSLSQAIWASSILKDDFGTSDINTTFMYEPLTRKMIKSCQFDKAFKHSIDWVNDEPFSSVPSITASYIACAFLDDHRKALDICENGLISNPNDPMLKNNYVYSLLATDQVQKAYDIFSSIDKSENESNTTYIATYGLLLIKQNNIEAGRKNYLKAIYLAQKQGNKFQEELANLHLIKSEININQLSKEDLLQQLEKHKYQNQQPEVVYLRNKVFDQIINMDA